MKNSTRAIVAGTALLALGIIAPAQAAAPERTTDRGENANLFFDASQEITCADGSLGTLFSNGFLTARQNVIRENGTRRANAALELTVSAFSTCDFSFQSGFGVLDAPSYSQNKATSAQASGGIAIFDTATGMPLGTAAVNVRWTATENTSHTTNSVRQTFGNTTVIARSTGSFADATVTGSITLNGRDLLAGANKSGNLGTNVNGTMTVVKATR
jgi:hypothetical protein